MTIQQKYEFTVDLPFNVEVYAIKAEELGIRLREHQAYKECFEFYGDVCDECERLSADLDAALEDKWQARIANYNFAYADYIRRCAAAFGQSDITEQCLLNAHDWASGNFDVRPPEGWRTGDEHACADGVCGRCNGDGMLPHFTHIARGVCFHCDGSGKCPDAVTTEVA